MPICKQCQQQFLIYSEDKEFYRRIGVLEPKLCPDCRQQNRIIFRNFKTLYSRKSDLSGQAIVSMFNRDSPYKVYSIDEWWSDKWEGKQYGRDYNFSKSFFEQFQELNLEVPKFNIMNTKSENCQYSNMTTFSNNCYLVFGCVQDENCYYGHIVWESQECVDCLYVYQCQSCYECVDCLHSYNLKFCQECENCFDSEYCYDCTGCNNCFGCVGQRHASYKIYNQQFTEQEYKKILKKIDFKEIQALKLSMPRKNLNGYYNENVSGEHLYNCYNVHDSFDVKKSENSRYLYTIKDQKEGHDISFSIGGELIYNCITCCGNNIICSHICVDCVNIAYCDSCMNCQDCFGCSGLIKKKFCIFNKQYAEDDYKNLRASIINQMKKTGEYGNFFPAQYTPYAYNESIINEYYPLTKESAIKKGYSWKDTIESLDSNDQPKQNAKVCSKCQKKYKLINQEIKFYKKNNLLSPPECPNCRHEKRMNLRNKRQLYSRLCQKCNKKIQTTYTPDRPEKILCENCYNKEIY